MTVYVVDRDTALKLTKDLHANFGDRLSAPEELRVTDFILHPGLGMRFAPQGDAAYDQYGVQGFAGLKSANREVFTMPDAKAASDVVTVKSFPSLVSDYGAFFLVQRITTDCLLSASHLQTAT